jgi:hypothetical protein
MLAWPTLIAYWSQVVSPSIDNPASTLQVGSVLEPYATTVPGFFIFVPSRAKGSAPLRLLVEAAKEFAVRRLK